MAYLTHKPAGWLIAESVAGRDDKGNETKTEVLVSRCQFDIVEDALAYARVVFPAVVIVVKCDTCSSSRDVEPEPVGPTFVMSCRKCRAVESTYHPPSDAEQGKLLKHPRVIHELSRPEWLNSTFREVRKFGLKTTGVNSIDKALRLPYAPLKQRTVDVVISQSDAPTECQICGGEIGDGFIDGVVRGNGWAYFCLPGHKRNGIGLGLGRGQLYGRRDDGSYVKTEG